MIDATEESNKSTFLWVPPAFKLISRILIAFNNLSDIVGCEIDNLISDEKAAQKIWSFFWKVNRSEIRVIETMRNLTLFVLWFHFVFDDTWLRCQIEIWGITVCADNWFNLYIWVLAIRNHCCVVNCI